MMRHVLAALALCLTCTWHQDAQAQDAERNYEGVFDGLLVLPQYVEKIKLFDRMAFADGQERYVAAGLRKVTFGARKQEVYRASVFYDGTLASQPKFIFVNDGMLKGVDFAPYLNNSKTAVSADITIIGVDGKRLAQLREQDERTAYLNDMFRVDPKSEQETINEATCVITSLHSNYRIDRTVAFTLYEANHDATIEHKGKGSRVRQPRTLPAFWLFKCAEFAGGRFSSIQRQNWHVLDELRLQFPLPNILSGRLDGW